MLLPSLLLLLLRRRPLPWLLLLWVPSLLLLLLLWCLLWVGLPSLLLLWCWLPLLLRKWPSRRSLLLLRAGLLLCRPVSWPCTGLGRFHTMPAAAGSSWFALLLLWFLALLRQPLQRLALLLLPRATWLLRRFMPAWHWLTAAAASASVGNALLSPLHTLLRNCAGRWPVLLPAGLML
jgi:hypothetical protein